MRLTAVFCALLFALSCGRAKTPPPEPKKAPAGKPLAAGPEHEPADNLLELAHGAAVIARSGEHSLEVSAAYVIDGDPLTEWRSAQSDADRTLVFALPALARVTSAGVLVPAHKWDAPVDTRIDGSLDNVTWRELADLRELSGGEREIVSFAPADVRYLRFRFVQPNGRMRFYTAIRSVFAKGQLLAQPDMPDVTGCWSINGQEARLEQHGNRVSGVIRNDPPVIISGARDARSMRVMWLRGPQWGHALVTIDPARKALSGVRWHEEVNAKNAGEAWYGEPVPCTAPLTFAEGRLAQAILHRAKHWTAYSDDSLDVLAALIRMEPKQRFRIVTHTPERLAQVRNALQNRVDRSRVELMTSPPEVELTNESLRVMAAGVELHMLP